MHVVAKKWIASDTVDKELCGTPSDLHGPYKASIKSRIVRHIEYEKSKQKKTQQSNPASIHSRTNTPNVPALTAPYRDHFVAWKDTFTASS